MAIVQTILAALGRQAGKLLNTIFGWATTTLFGKVPQEKQIYLSAIAFGSVIWIVLVVGVIFPEAGVFLLSFVNLPEWVQERWVRIAMLVAALVLPAIIGITASRINDSEEQPKGGKAVLQRILHGYPYTVATSLALILMLLFVPILKIRTLSKRWTTEHLPMIVEDQDYMKVVDEVKKALDKSDYPVARAPAGFMLSLPIKVLTFFTGKSDLVAEKLTKLSSRRVELILHPSDLAISGSKYDAARVREIVVQQLAFSPAYMTWTKEANELEDRLSELWDNARKGGLVSLQDDIQKLQQFERDLQKAEVQYEEWEVLFREKLLLERGMLQVASGLSNRLQEPAEVPAEKIGAESIPSAPSSLAKKLIPQGLMLLGVSFATWAFKSKQQENQDPCADQSAA